MPNHETIASPGMIPFWETIQGVVNSHYYNLHVKDWGMNDAMNVVIDDVKQHLNYKVPGNNLWLTRHARDNRLGIVNHTVALNLWSEYEKTSDTTTIALKCLTYKLFSPSSNELHLNYLEISMDRGFWECHVMNMLALAGAHVFGTITRCVWFPFTCGQTLKK